MQSAGLPTASCDDSPFAYTFTAQVGSIGRYWLFTCVSYGVLTSLLWSPVFASLHFFQTFSFRYVSAFYLHYQCIPGGLHDACIATAQAWALLVFFQLRWMS